MTCSTMYQAYNKENERIGSIVQRNMLEPDKLNARGRRNLLNIIMYFL